MRNLLYKIDISSLSWCSSVFHILLYFCFCFWFHHLPLKSYVTYVLSLLLLCSLKNIILGPTCFSLWFLIFCCHYLLELPLSFWFITIFGFVLGLQIFVLPSLSSFFLYLFSSLLLSLRRVRNFYAILAICMYMLIGNKEKKKQEELKRELKMKRKW